MLQGARKPGRTEVRMYVSHPMTPDIERALAGADPIYAGQIRDVFRDYASLLKSAARDREAVLGFVDALKYRFDDLPSDPEYARTKAGRMVESEKFSAVRDALIDAQLAVGSGKDISEYVEEVLSKPPCSTPQT